jgi:predicted nucleic acid-binding protein
VRRIVSNTGPVLHLKEIDSLHLLRDAGQVFIPPPVEDELRRRIPEWGKNRPDWLEVTEVTEEELAPLRQWVAGGIVHAGEAAAIALARQLKADWFLTDDTAARVLARSLSIEIHGSLGAVLWAAATGKLDRQPAMDMVSRLASSSLWLSPRILVEAHRALAIIFQEKNA